MKTPLPESLWSAIQLAAGLLSAPGRSLALQELIRGSVLGSRGGQFRGRSVLLAVRDPFAAATALIELDGQARRIVLCPADLAPEHLPYIAETAEVDAAVSDTGLPGVPLWVAADGSITRNGYVRGAELETEWILLTSGTTGRPKLVVHTLRTLAGAIEAAAAAPHTVWSTFYDIRRYGGLQIFLRAMLTGSSLVLAGPSEPTADFLSRAGACRVTHISGTPSHWRRVAMSPEANLIAPEYIRLSGEIAYQSILNQLRAIYPCAKIGHAFASTEAGVAFAVNDEVEGFPETILDSTPGVEMKVVDGSLRIRSERTAKRYLGGRHLHDAESFVDTADMVEARGGRYFFVGRRDGVINVGGQKVHPEEIESVINRHPRVQGSVVRQRKNSITGGIVVADVVLKDIVLKQGSENGVSQVQREITALCRQMLSAHKVPVSIKFVPALQVSETGKMIRGEP